MGATQHHHRSSLKQTNKPFKSKHATKSTLKDKSKGRVQRASPKQDSANLRSSQTAALRSNRRNTAKQIQQQKSGALVNAARLFNGVNGAPRIVAVIPLSADVNAKGVVQQLAKAVPGSEDETDAAIDDCPDYGLFKLKSARFKTSLQFMLLPHREFLAALDAAQVADYVVFVLSAHVEVDRWGETLLRTLAAQGLPKVVACVGQSADMDDVVDMKSTQKSLLSFMQFFQPTLCRVFDLSDPRSSSNSADKITALRALCEGTPSPRLANDDERTFLVAEDLRTDSVGADSGGISVSITGVLRGVLAARRAVHIPCLGEDFQIEKILSAPPSRTMGGDHLKKPTADMEVEPTMLSSFPEPRPPAAEAESELANEQVQGDEEDFDADSFVSTNAPDAQDELLKEQTWPTEDEMRSAPANLRMTGGDGGDGVKRKKKRVPKGWSAYQAAWIPDGDEEGEDDNADEVDNLEDDLVDQDGPPLIEDDEDMDAFLAEGDGSDKKSHREDFEDLDIDEEAKQLQAWRTRGPEKDRSDEAAEDAEFPDEIDTPQNVPARERFARFRGLQSLRTSPWDPYENLPNDYARLFRFQDDGLKRMEVNLRRRVGREVEGVVEPGTRVTIVLKNVPPTSAQALLSTFNAQGTTGRPVVIYGLLPHERKTTLLNFAIRRNTEYDGVVKSKDPLILLYGPRRLHVRPIFSEHTRGGGKGVNNVHKYERFLLHGTASVLTTYGPVTFGEKSCVLLRPGEGEEGLREPELVATGSFLNADTERIIAKRIVLTGHPFKVHKKTATVRYMFFNSDDVLYFKPVQLHTKYGRTGHIKESLGTHGYFKAHFDGPVNQMDTVCMSLYKRVFPRWMASAEGNRPIAQNTTATITEVQDDAMEE